MGRSVPILAAVFSLALVAAPVAAAAGTAEVQFVHAVPGVGTADLAVGDADAGSAGFGDVTDSVAVPAGNQKLDLTAPGGVEVTGAETFEAGRSYTLVAMAKGDSAEIRSYENRGAKSGVAELRMIHSAPELGDPNLVLNGKVIAKGARYTDATRYWTLDPGTYSFQAQDPSTGDAVVSDRLTLSPGTSQTALVVGSEGEPARVVLASGDTATPAAAPATGFGGLADEGPNVLAAILAAFAAGSLGLLAYCRISGRRRGRFSARS